MCVRERDCVCVCVRERERGGDLAAHGGKQGLSTFQASTTHPPFLTSLPQLITSEPVPAPFPFCAPRENLLLFVSFGGCGIINCSRDVNKCRPVVVVWSPGQSLYIAVKSLFIAVQSLYIAVKFLFIAVQSLFIAVKSLFIAV